MAGEPDWVPAGVDTRRANIARLYDYLLGGSHNFLADQDVGRALAAVEPEVRAIARANRAFLGRAVRFLAAAGIRQFLDIGSGIPTEGNVHEVAQRANRGARVVYADIDPVAIAHSRTILAGRENAAIIEGDLREPEKILAHDDTRRLIDFSQPAGLLLVSVLHYVADADAPWRAVATLRDALAPGSYLVLCHGTAEGRPAVVQAAGKVFNRSVATQSQPRSRREIMGLFGDFALVDPGLVHIPLWRPDSPADVPSDPSRFWCLAGVARKPLRRGIRGDAHAMSHNAWAETWLTRPRWPPRFPGPRLASSVTGAVRGPAPLGSAIGRFQSPSILFVQFCRIHWRVRGGSGFRGGSGAFQCHMPTVNKSDPRGG